MDVNRDNFQQLLPTIVNDINNADYVAIDCEFTGILPFSRMNYLDTPEDRYRQHYESSRRYFIIQMGLAMVRCIDSKENRYALTAYNFYLFSENERDGFDFLSKSSSLQFLASNHFDFTQLFLKGIPFISQVKYLEKLKKRQFLPLPAATQNNTSDNVDTLKTSIPGFSEVIWKLQESGKPIVGHNMYVDLLHTINQFYKPLPRSYAEYKSLVKSLFPRLIDTKTIGSLPMFQNIISNTTLSEMYKTVFEPSFPSCRFETGPNFRYATGKYEHTAGYDAACTAVCFSKMMAFIASKTNFQQNPIQHTWLNELNGKIFFVHSFDFKYSDMFNNDVQPDRSCVFYIMHPLTWSTANTRDFFSQCNLLFYDHVNHSTDVISIPLKEETVETMLAKLKAVAAKESISIIPYAQYHQSSTSKTIDVDLNN